MLLMETTMPVLSLQSLHDTLSVARTPEEIFGSLTPPPLEALRAAYRRLVRIAHPDRNPSAPTLAQATFTLLETWRLRAQERIAAGLYGTTSALTEIRTRKAAYAIHNQNGAAGYATFFAAMRVGDRTPCLLKLTNEPSGNDLALRDADALRQLSANTHLARYLPTLLETFLTDDGGMRRRASIFEAKRHTHSLEAVRAAYPTGLDARDAAWMFNRLLEALAIAHGQGVVHGALVPANVHVITDTHGMELAEWGYSVEVGLPLTAILSTHQAWYPPEIFTRKPATPAMDIFLAARLLLYLLGVNPLEAVMPRRVPAPMQRLVQACLLPAPHRRPQSAATVRDHFRDLLHTLYGPPTFRPFTMPP
jgi:serine/threonine protein kinase